MPDFTSASAQVQKIEFRPDDPQKGARNAPVTVVVFSDFQCPFCKNVEPTITQLLAANPNDVRVIWKNLPLAMHPQAMPAALAAEAAREQGKFWEMHDLMFQNQGTLSPDQFDVWAKQLGLDVAKFKAARASAATRARVEEDAQLGAKVAPQGTPTLYVNCSAVVGAQPLDVFQKVVAGQLARAADLRKAGVKLDATFYERICEDNVRNPQKG
jgi:protein-disulfide isomerase